MGLRCWGRDAAVLPAPLIKSPCNKHKLVWFKLKAQELLLSIGGFYSENLARNGNADGRLALQLPSSSSKFWYHRPTVQINIKLQGHFHIESAH